MDTTQTNNLDTAHHTHNVIKRWAANSWAHGIAIADREIVWRNRAKVTMYRGAAPAERLVISTLSDLALAYL